MSERFLRLFYLPEALYAEGAPVLVAAGALLKDSETGNVLAQLKFHSISDKVIKAITVQITPFDTANKPLGEQIEYQYLDLKANRDEEFGQKVPVKLPNAAARAFKVAVKEVVFEDNSIWTSGGSPWEELSRPVPLEKAFQDAALAEQFRWQYGQECKFAFKREKDLWRCACGAVNHKEESICHRCGKQASVLENVDLEELRENLAQRIEREKEKAAAEKAAAEAKALREAEAARAKAKKAKKIAMIVTPIAIVLIGAGIMISNNIKKSNSYQEASTLMADGEYEEAAEIFDRLGNYKDSQELYAEADAKAHPLKALCRYIQENGEYQKTIDLEVMDLMFAGYSDNALKNVPNAEESLSEGTFQNIYVKEDEPDMIWTQLHATGNNNLDVDMVLQISTEDMRVDYACKVDNVVTLLDQSQAGVLLNGSTDMKTYTKGKTVEVESIRLNASETSQEVQAGYELPDNVRDSYIPTMTSMVSAVINNLNFYLGENLDISVKDLGFDAY